MSILSQVRKSIQKSIDINPITIYTKQRPKVDNGFGVMVEDLTASAVLTELGVASVKRRYKPDPLKTNAKTPYDYLVAYYLLADYTAVSWLVEGLRFEYHGVYYRTNKPDVKYIGGEISHIIAVLEEITRRDTGDIV